MLHVLHGKFGTSYVAVLLLQAKAQKVLSSTRADKQNLRMAELALLLSCLA